jgi:hypothetical protein
LADGEGECDCDREEERDDEGDGVNDGSGDDENWIGVIFVKYPSRWAPKMMMGSHSKSVEEI